MHFFGNTRLALELRITRKLIPKRLGHDITVYLNYARLIYLEFEWDGVYSLRLGTFCSLRHVTVIILSEFICQNYICLPSNTLYSGKQKHFHQNSRSHTMSNEVTPDVWLHAVTSPLKNWYANHEVLAINMCPEAVVQRYSVKKVFLEISQNSQKNTCARVSF